MRHVGQGRRGHRLAAVCCAALSLAAAPTEVAAASPPAVTATWPGPATDAHGTVPHRARTADAWTAGLSALTTGAGGPGAETVRRPGVAPSPPWAPRPLHAADPLGVSRGPSPDGPDASWEPTPTEEEDGATPTGQVLPVLPLGAGLASIGLGLAFIGFRMRRG
ncbi:hypothetical protein E0L36_18415 [Streptomyces sp. AJS327]|uniref:hypothetical protein n=1 Tax=Streptomyces sp. AJS327 TaxID=2545265 RepID=UPI0015E03926|nr:hypothetical protein [Streptomyces sp. AJS327]MBA0052777.1 hypothetical protein [Streptomyces sp. AJS327]